MSIEAKVSPIQRIMNRVISNNSFKFEEIVEETGEDKKEIVESILINLSLNGYIQFDNNSKYYVPSGKRISY